MKIVVCIKQVPDTTEVKLIPVKPTHSSVRGYRVLSIRMTRQALEFALQLKDTYDAHVTVVTMGPPQAELVLRRFSNGCR